MNLTPSFIQPPSKHEKIALRLMIMIGLISMLFFLYSMLQYKNISYFPLYVLLMITMVYYCLKFLHEWYHYFSISSSQKPNSGKKYTVDILTTYCAGEPFDMLEETLEAIQRITYAHTAWCCDEADDPYVKELCLRLGVNHVTRIIKKDAKAGNINNALQFATGELCVVLDPDHIPSPEFLDHIVAYFDDESIGFVQIVQAYYNQHESLVAKGAAQQTYQFYGPMMMAMNTYGTVQAIGANCTFRRSALDSIGGHASGLSEDMHTAMQLHARGWRSIYVPAILTRGLVPATMSSYYKQQLKWSRGTWELLLVVYPKLFKKFTWRQKIHYLTLPFHYLSGFIFLINFLIPVLSLFTGYIPLKMDVVAFLLAALPLFMMSVVIRHYVQKWVAEEKERGFHLIGGILQIGTWWIHSIGFIYTIIRKKVPYIPTPKNDHDSLPLSLNMPNILVALVSLVAITYGLWRDYNPYTIFMVALASMQIFFMIFIFAISGFVHETSVASNVALKLREKTWLIITMHGILRRYSLAISLIVIILFVFAYRQQQLLPDFLPKALPKLNIFYYGVKRNNIYGDADKPLSAISIADRRKDIAIISLAVPWGKGENNSLDTAFLNKIFKLNAVPLLFWKPLQLDSNSEAGRDKNVFGNIVHGRYDTSLLSFARQVANLNKPVFLCYNTDSDSNKHSIFEPNVCVPQDYIAAWQHVHQLFDSVGGDNVIWIWQPWEVAKVENYFPGKSYVDWLGLDNTALSFDRLQTNAISFGFRYKPYHLLPVFNSGLPVMITGLRGSSVNFNNWWKDTWEGIQTNFPEIKSVIIGTDKNQMPQPGTPLIPFPLDNILTSAPKGSLSTNEQQLQLAKDLSPHLVYKFPSGIKSVVYDKGYYWFRNRHTLNLKIIEADIREIKKIGVNTIERTMPGFYDNTLNKVLIANKMNLVPRFWLLATPEVIDDNSQLKKQKASILSVIKENLNNKYIIAWSLGDDVLYNLANQTYQPDYLLYQQKYLSWLSDVCNSIRNLDTTRPIIIDVHWDAKGRKRYEAYRNQVPQINKYMLEADTKYRQGLQQPLSEGMIWGKVSVELWSLLPSIANSGSIPCWQDLENTDYIILNGLLDFEGRKKESYRTVINTWGNKSARQSLIPDIKILKPAKATYENTLLTYHILFNTGDNRWKIYSNEVAGLHFEWYLVRVDQYGNTMFIKKKGEGASIALTIPQQAQFYRLYVEAVLGGDVKQTFESLNIPLE